MENTITTLIHFIRELKVRVTPESIEKELEIHPAYPSLLSLSDALNKWHIANAAYKVKPEDLADVICPFIISTKRAEFMLVNHIDEDKVIVSNGKWNKRQLKTDEFKRLFYGGIVLLAAPDEKSGEKDYQKKSRQKLLNNLRAPFALSGTLLILVVGLLMHSSYPTAFSLSVALLSFFKSIGLITTVLLLTFSIDGDNPLIQRLCTSMNSNCNSILSSPAAKIVEELSWSEVGFFYFAGTWLILLFNSESIGLLQVLAILNLLCLPYTIYSIYYQARVIKQWCIFCCTVQALFWLESFVFLPYLLQDFRLLTRGEWGSLLIGMSIPILFWIFIKPYLLQVSQLYPTRQQLNKLKYNSKVFSAVLNEKAPYPLLDEEYAILLGNLNAKHLITVVSNPYCRPCAEAHKFLDSWLDISTNIRLQIIFNMDNDLGTKLADHFMSLKTEQDSSFIKLALNDWYGQNFKNYKSWAKNYPVEEKASNEESLKRQKEWCKFAEVKGTPQIFINGLKLPGYYKAEDLPYFI
jgi:uncharacterized membrane protein